jgi:heavy metal translocating P-type ATPase
MSCALCSLQLPKNPVRKGENAFCCSGCLTVFNIIGKERNFQSHPLFQEALKAGVISNLQMVDSKEESAPNREEVKFHLQIDGLWCPSCAEAIRMILMRQKGVCNCVVDYATDLAVILINPLLVSKKRVIELIQKLGYKAGELLSQEKSHLSRFLWLRFGIAVFCTMNIMMLSYPLYAAHFEMTIEGFDLALGWFSFALTLPLITYVAWPIWRRLTVTLKSGLFAMETLVFIGVMTAFILSTYHLLCRDPTSLYFDSLSMVVSFVLLGKILEKKAKFSAKETLLRLTHFLPKKAYKKVDSGEYAYVPIKEISCGDTLLVRTGEKIVLDGIVIEGEGLVDESVMTGEVLPLQKTKGSRVVGGSLVKRGSLTLRVTKEREQSLLGQIITLIEGDLIKKNTTDTLVNQITCFFVPTILLLALVTLLLFTPTRALTLLLIACPCALGIAVPLAQSRLFFRFAEKGALIRNRNCLPLLGQNPFFVFDKTGTLTEGAFRVFRGLEALPTAKVAILKALVSHSNHPISLAISDALFCSPAPLEKVSEIIGRGIEGNYQGKEYLLGSERLLREKGIALPCHSHATTVVYFAEEQTLLAEIHLGDRLREHLPKLEGVILSGDSPNLVSDIAQKCGFLWGKGGMDPIQKREEVMELKKQGRPVVMVGDGINDAPAMTAADVGISVVSATDLAVEVSDILLTTDHLDALPSLCQIAKKCQRIIYQNLFWAFFYNIVGIILAFLGLLNPLFAASAMILSSLFVTCNSYRI